MHRTKLITHKGHSIVHIDLTGEHDLEIAFASFDKAQELICRFPPKSARLVTDVTGARYNAAATERMKEFSKAVSPFIKASAAVGIDTLKAIILRAVSTVAGHPIKTFDDIESAKDWLASQ
jgi:hypothetical protein